MSKIKLSKEFIRNTVKLALNEDLYPSGDITSNLLKNNLNKIKKHIPNVLIPELDSNLSGPPLVTTLSKRLDKAVSIDNGIMHMVGLANIPMIVLFGPTKSSKFVPKINKIDILDSKLIYNSDDISKITEDDVLSLI